MKYKYDSNFPRLLFFEGALQQIVPGQVVETEEDLGEVWGMIPVKKAPVKNIVAEKEAVSIKKAKKKKTRAGKVVDATEDR